MISAATLRLQILLKSHQGHANLCFLENVLVSTTSLSEVGLIKSEEELNFGRNFL